MNIAATTLVLHILANACLAQGQVGHFGSTWKPRLFELPSNTTTGSFEVGATATAVATISLADTIAKILPTQFGVNTTFRTGSSVLNRAGLYRQARFGTFRWPAGSGSNAYFWDGSIPSKLLLDSTKILPINGAKSSDLNPSAFAAFLDSTGTQANVVVNYFYARYGTTAEDVRPGATDSSRRAARVQQAADYAAGLVHRMNIELKSKIVNWEIGNECYGKWEQGFQVDGVPVTGKEYGEDFRVFAKAMKAVDPSIKVGAVVGWNEAWTSGVLPEVKDAADFLILHNYPVSEKNATASAVFNSVGSYKSIADTLNAQVLRHTGKPGGFYPIALTEFNSSGYPSTNMINGLYISQVLGELAKNKYGLANIWVGEWGGGSDPFNHGIISTDDPGQPAYSPRPGYMPYYFYGRYFGDHMIKSNVTGDAISVHASVFSGPEASDSHIGLVIINTSGSDQFVEIKLGTQNHDRAYWHTFHADNLDSANTRFHVNGLTGETPGGGPANFTTIPAYQASFSDNATLKVHKYSATFMALVPNPGPSETRLQAKSSLRWSFHGRNTLRLKGLATAIKAASVFLPNGTRQKSPLQSSMMTEEGTQDLQLPHGTNCIRFIRLEMMDGSKHILIVPTFLD